MFSVMYCERNYRIGKAYGNLWDVHGDGSEYLYDRNNPLVGSDMKAGLFKGGAELREMFTVTVQSPKRTTIFGRHEYSKSTFIDALYSHTYPFNAYDDFVFGSIYRYLHILGSPDVLKTGVDLHLDNGGYFHIRPKISFVNREEEGPVDIYHQRFVQITSDDREGGVQFMDPSGTFILTVLGRLSYAYFGEQKNKLYDINFPSAAQDVREANQALQHLHFFNENREDEGTIRNLYDHMHYIWRYIYTTPTGVPKTNPPELPADDSPLTKK